ncbi:ABC transporter ATP-binding protein [Falsigemmobacter intermedius]|uniref:ABC transporter ATP-binding protein n=1 Tax=Falsigemmobacter intermedius TaxID=1553448 RepID=A0A444MCH3_9RHOB|nr:ABC transporter ATP-binding protein [Falsigemmobacter intermedius]RWY41716.1 ABC transporter ATP-binding protein [Falsigemmobacter intermedius]
MSDPILDVRDLRIEIRNQPVVENVTFAIHPGEILSLVGESGCGKSLTAFGIMGLLPEVARIAGGSVKLNGRELAGLREREMLDLRGREMSIIFQEPFASLNPLMPVGRQVAESLIRHRGLSKREAAAEALAMLAEVGIPDPATRAKQYPFELSGGMCQRVMIAMALICRPRLLIADEPTTALDVTIQAQILDLILRLRDETGTAILLITHDMGVVAETADRVAVMYAGNIVEENAAEPFFTAQSHPYARMLLNTIPRADTPPQTLLPVIEGRVPDIGKWPEGCRYAPRCPLADAACLKAPALIPSPSGGRAACWHSDRVGEIR